MITVGKLKKLLDQAQDRVPVVLCISLAGDARKKHSPWVDDFKVCWSDRNGKSCVEIYGEQKEI